MNELASRHDAQIWDELTSAANENARIYNCFLLIADVGCDVEINKRLLHVSFNIPYGLWLYVLIPEETDQNLRKSRNDFSYGFDIFPSS